MLHETTSTNLWLKTFKNMYLFQINNLFDIVFILIQLWISDQSFTDKRVVGYLFNGLWKKQEYNRPKGRHLLVIILIL